MAGRFSRRVRGWAQAHAVPVIDCKNQERKHEIAEEFLKKNACVRGVFLILVSRAPATVWNVHRSKSGVIVNLESKRSFVGPPDHQDGGPSAVRGPDSPQWS
jgi:hypothetical protein